MAYIVLACIVLACIVLAYIVSAYVVLAYIMLARGWQLFGGDLANDASGEKPRLNYDSFFNAFLTLFIVLTGENWNEVGGISVIGRGNVLVIGRGKILFRSTADGGHPC